MAAPVRTPDRRKRALRMPPPRRRLAAWLLALAALLPAAARGAALGQLQVTVAGEQAQLTFQLDDAFDAKLLARLESGLPTGFVYRFELHRDRKHWWDDKLRAAELEVVAMYNAVTAEYLVNFKLDGRLIDSRLARSKDELLVAMTRFERVPLFSLAGIRSGTRLLVKGKAELGSRTILAFIPVDVETDWVESRKFRVP